jgi:tubulin polyglutamylase TTLL5
MWSNIGYKSDIYQVLTKYQKVNHFPRSTELTRKDSMYSRMARMQAMYGEKHFNFIPKTFILPKEYTSLIDCMSKDKDQLWIFKPSASSQGRGIYISNSIDEINSKSPQVASQYIDNPLLFNGYKFDFRVYVAITSICPLRIYIYREGLARLATVLYNSIPEDKNTSKFSHLTNYSINKHNANFKPNDGSNSDFASKVSFKNTNEYLK